MKPRNEQMWKWLGHLQDENWTIEVRAIDLRGGSCKYFVAGCAADAYIFAEEQQRDGVLITTNLNQRKPQAKGMTKNDMIEVINHLVFDFDPVRPRGVNASPSEVEAARKAADHCRDSLRSMGWKEPALAFTGSGFHLIYRFNFMAPHSADHHAQGLMRDLYKWMDEHFSTPEVSFDRTVKNPGRVVRLYGLPNQKCPSLPDRPQRDTWIEMPDVFEINDTDIILSTIATLMPSNVIAFPKRKEAQSISPRLGLKDIRTFDIVAWAQSLGLYKRHIEDNKHSVTCPWEADHGSHRDHGINTVIFEPNGDWPGIFCHHHACSGRGIKDLMRDFPDWKDWAESEGQSHG